MSLFILFGEGEVSPYAAIGGEIVETQNFASLQFPIRQYAATPSPGGAHFKRFKAQKLQLDASPPIKY